MQNQRIKHVTASTANPDFSKHECVIDSSTSTSIISDKAEELPKEVPVKDPEEGQEDVPVEEPKEDSEKEKRDLILSHQDAWAGSPHDYATCGEEDIGSGLESLVTRDDQAI